MPAWSRPPRFGITISIWPSVARTAAFPHSAPDGEARHGTPLPARERLARRDMARLCLPVSAWPAADQRAWAKAVRPDDPFLRNPASRWSAATRRHVEEG